VKPLCVDLYCGLGGWADGFLSEGYRVIGFDIEAHDYGMGGYPGELVLRDVRSIHGSEFKDVAVIVGSSPCQEFSYRAMPWKRAKALPPPYLGMELFQAQFRIQREAIETAGRYIPLIVENVRGAQKWVGRARWHYGSFYLWGDVPALMPFTRAMKNSGGSWFAIDGSYNHGEANDPRRMKSDAGTHERTEGSGRPRFIREGVKQAGISGERNNGKGDKWFQDGAAKHGSKSDSRKAASALIAKIPFPLAQHIARCFKPMAKSQELKAVANG
jgi:hypothetical protein